MLLNDVTLNSAPPLFELVSDDMLPEAATRTKCNAQCACNRDETNICNVGFQANTELGL